MLCEKSIFDSSKHCCFKVQGFAFSQHRFLKICFVSCLIFKHFLIDLYVHSADFNKALKVIDDKPSYIDWYHLLIFKYKLQKFFALAKQSIKLLIKSGVTISLKIW